MSGDRELKERVVEINRVAKVVKGGRRFSFTALVVIGDEVDRVGVGYGKAREVPLAISKAVDDAKKNLFTVRRHGTTITHEILGAFGAARVLLRPASEGTGVIAGGGVRAVLELAGIRDILAKSLGTTNPINMLKATVNGLQSLRRPEEVAKKRGVQICDVLPKKKVARRRRPRSRSPWPPSSPPSCGRGAARRRGGRSGARAGCGRGRGRGHGREGEGCGAAAVDAVVDEAEATVDKARDAGRDQGRREGRGPDRMKARRRVKGGDKPPEEPC